MSGTLCSPDSSWYLTGGPPRFDVHNSCRASGVVESLHLVRSNSDKSDKSGARSRSPMSSHKPPVSESSGSSSSGGESRKRKDREDEDEEEEEEEEEKKKKEASSPTGTIGKDDKDNQRKRDSHRRTAYMKEPSTVTKDTINSVREELKKEKQRSRDLARLIAGRPA